MHLRTGGHDIQREKVTAAQEILERRQRETMAIVRYHSR